MTTNDYQTKPCACPYCGKVNDAQLAVTSKSDTRPPQEGDVTICIHCAGIAFFDAEGNVVRDDDELQAMKIIHPVKYDALMQVQQQLKHQIGMP